MLHRLVGISLVVIVLALLAPAALAQGPTVQVSQHPELGAILTDEQGMTLYLFTRDEENLSNCYDQCAEAWPPLLSPEGEEPVAGEGLTGELGLTERTDGTMQVTYNGMPLYYWVDDTEPGQTTGEGVNNVWYVVHPDISTMMVNDPVINVTEHPELGQILTMQGMTLYLYTRDGENVSNCYEQCAVNWPPLLVPENGEPVASEGLPGQLSVTERTDGSRQVTYNRMPLYFWINDSRPGQATGQDVGQVWYVLHPDISTMAVTSPVIDITEHPTLGPILTNQGMTLYLYTQDEENVSNCYEQCAVNWPPLLVGEGGEPVAGGEEGLPGELGVTERTDGTMQVTYNGMPLYFFIRDFRFNQARGEGAGDVWFVVPPEEAAE